MTVNHSIFKILLEINPAYVIMVIALLMGKLPRIICKILALITPIYAAIIISIMSLYDIQISYKLAKFNLISTSFNQYTIIVIAGFLIALFAATIYSFSHKNFSKELSAAFFHAGAAIGVILSGDLISFFIMWELMSIGSAILIFINKSESSYQAGMRYVLMHVFGGAILLTGISLYSINSYSMLIPQISLNISELSSIYEILDLKNLYLFLILIGIAINAAIPPFSAWLADSYSEANPSATIYLSVFTTKTAIYSILTIFAGSDILIWLGLFTSFYGLLYSILSNDIRKILCYSIICQIGMMLLYIGEGSEIALKAVSLNIFSDIIYKTLLFMIIGAIITITNKTKLSELGGLYKETKFLTIMMIIGLLSVAAMPFTNSFITKKLLFEALNNHLYIKYYSYFVSASLIIAIGFRILWFIFFSKNKFKEKIGVISKYQVTSIILMGTMIYLPGIFPKIFFFDLLNIDYLDITYSLGESSKQFQVLLSSALSFFVFYSLLKPKDIILIDFDWFYRKIIKNTYNYLEFLFVNIFKTKEVFEERFYEFADQIFTLTIGEDGKLKALKKVNHTMLLSFLMIIILLLISLRT